MDDEYVSNATHMHTHTTHIRSLLMVRKATCMNFQDPPQTAQTTSPVDRLPSQGRESNAAAPRHTMTPLITFTVLFCGDTHSDSMHQNNRNKLIAI